MLSCLSYNAFTRSLLSFFVLLFIVQVAHSQTDSDTIRYVKGAIVQYGDTAFVATSDGYILRSEHADVHVKNKWFHLFYGKYLYVEDHKDRDSMLTDQFNRAFRDE